MYQNFSACILCRFLRENPSSQRHGFPSSPGGPGLRLGLVQCTKKLDSTGPEIFRAALHQCSVERSSANKLCQVSNLQTYPSLRHALRLLQQPVVSPTISDTITLSPSICTLLCTGNSQYLTLWQRNPSLKIVKVGAHTNLHPVKRLFAPLSAQAKLIPLPVAGPRKGPLSCMLSCI